MVQNPNEYLESLVAASRIAQQEFEKYPQEVVDMAVKAIGKAIYDNAVELAHMAVDETRMGNYLDAPPVVVGAKNWIAPAYEYDKVFFPQGSWIVDAIHQRLMPISGYQIKNQNYTDVELLRRAKMGV